MIEWMNGEMLSECMNKTMDDWMNEYVKSLNE